MKIIGFYICVFAISSSLVFANNPRVPNAVLIGKNVQAQYIPKDEMEKYKYNKYEYWLSGTNYINEFSIEESSAFYTDLFSIIEKNFIKNITYETMLNKIFEGLAGFIGKIDITVTSKRILIHDKDLNLIGNFPAPIYGDTKAWANLIVHIILKLREINPRIEKAHPEQIHHLTATYLLKSLDINAKYTDSIAAQQKKSNRNSTTLGFSYRFLPYGIQVLSIIKDSPLYFTDVQEGDLLTHINTIQIKSLKPEEVEAILVNNNTDIVHLNGISYISSQPFDIYVRRAKIEIPSVITNLSNLNIPVITILNFKPNTAREFKDVIDELKKANISGIIIDIRGNNGGEFTEAIETANLLIDGGEILKTKGLSKDSHQIYTAKDGDILSTLPVVILADGTSRAEAEIFASIMDSSGRAVLIGSPTYGNGNISDDFTLSNKSEISFATKKAITPDGSAIDKIGVIPLVCLSTFTSKNDIDTFIMNVENGEFQDTRIKLQEPTVQDINNVRKSCMTLYPTDEAQQLPISLADTIIKNKRVYKILKEI